MDSRPAGIVQCDHLQRSFTAHEKTAPPEVERFRVSDHRLKFNLSEITPFSAWELFSFQPEVPEERRLLLEHLSALS